MLVVDITPALTGQHQSRQEAISRAQQHIKNMENAVHADSQDRSDLRASIRQRKLTGANKNTSS